MISEVHPSLDDSKGLAKSISNETLDLLVKTINSLQVEKQQRVVKVGYCKDYTIIYAVPCDSRWTKNLCIKLSPAGLSTSP